MTDKDDSPVEPALVLDTFATALDVQDEGSHMRLVFVANRESSMQMRENVIVARIVMTTADFNAAFPLHPKTRAAVKKPSRN